MTKNQCFFALVAMAGVLVPSLAAQEANKAGPDVLIFSDGEKLIGHLERADSSSVTFKSDMAGEITADWSKISELHSSQKFAVIPKGVKLTRHAEVSRVPQGTVSMTGQKLTVTTATPAAPQVIPVTNAAHVIDEATFQKNVVSSPGFFSGWAGTVAAGATLVEATQKSNTFSGAFDFVRAIPGESWLEPRNRTMVDFSAAYGKITQPATPTIKTNIIHASVERDEYLSSRVYGFGQAAWDHNFSQGLDLQQSYGGGLGWTAYKAENAELDFKASIDYIKQQFTISSQNENLIGAIIAQTYHRNFARGVVLTEGLSVTPAFNVPSAYSALANVTLSLPLYKRFNLAFGTSDSYLNNPPPGFKKNSFQFTAALAYSVQ